MVTARLAQTSTGDLDLSKGLRLESNPAANVTAKVKKVLNLWQVSWFLAAADGVPWIQQVLGRKNPDLTLAQNILQGAILNIPEIVSVSSMALTYDSRARSLSVKTSLVTTKGAIVVTVPLVVP